MKPGIVLASSVLAIATFASPAAAQCPTGHSTAEGRVDEAAAVRQRYDKAWLYADVTLVASRF
jgi:hypothetical protein